MCYFVVYFFALALHVNKYRINIYFSLKIIIILLLIYISLMCYEGKSNIYRPIYGDDFLRKSYIYVRVYVYIHTHISYIEISRAIF
jgi:hypothetical protein